MIRVKNIKLKNGKKIILNNISIDFNKGSCTAIIGNNGAGKTSLIKTITGIIKIDSGSISLKSSKIGYFADNDLYLDNLTAQEFFQININYQKNIKFIKNLIEKLDFKDFLKVKIKELSSGNKQKTKIINSLIQNPEIILRDEPTQHLDPKSRKQVHKIINTLKKQGKTIIYTTHYLEDIIEQIDNCIILENGSIKNLVNKNQIGNISGYFT